MTALSVDTRPGFIDKGAIALGRVLTAWGTRHAEMRPAPDYRDQTERFDRSRAAASHVLPQLPR